MAIIWCHFLLSQITCAAAASLECSTKPLNSVYYGHRMVLFCSSGLLLKSMHPWIFQVGWRLCRVGIPRLQQIWICTFSFTTFKHSVNDLIRQIVCLPQWISSNEQLYPTYYIGFNKVISSESDKSMAEWWHLFFCPPVEFNCADYS